MDVFTLIWLITKLVVPFIFVIVSVLYLIISKDYNYWKNRNVPHPRPFFIFGNLKYLMRKSFRDFFYDLWQKYPLPYVGAYFVHKPVLIVQDSELARRILVKDSSNFIERYIYAGSSDPIGGHNLFVAKNPLWTTIRKESTPMFTSSRLKKLTEFMNLNSKYIVERIEKLQDEQKTISLKDLFSRYTSDVVGCSVFGIRTSSLQDDNNALWKITTHMAKWTFIRGFEFSLAFLIPDIGNLLRVKFFSKDATIYLRGIYDNIMNDRTENPKPNENDLVQNFIKLREGVKKNFGNNADYADDVTLAQMAVFIFGSIETSSTALCYVLHEFAYHQDIQQKVYEEIKAATKNSPNEVLDYTEQLELRYMNACIQETIRKHPPVSQIDRYCSNDYQIDENLTIEKGTPVYINILAMHHNEKDYPEPMKWIPERFTGLNPDSDNRDFKFLPFGDGPRFCIGKRYGTAQVRSALVLIMLKYKILPHPDQPYEIEADPYSVLLSPKGGGLVTFVPRTGIE